MTIFLCRCHDEASQGRETPYGLSEWQIADDVLEAAVGVIRSREEGVWRLEGTLKQRMGVIKNFEDHGRLPVVVEPHCNGFPDPDQNGFFIISWHDNEGALRLAQSILDQLSRAMPKHRGLGICKADDKRRWVGTPKEFEAGQLGLLRGGQSLVVIPEICYLSNPREADWISRRANRVLVGQAMGRGVLDFLKKENRGVKNEPDL